MPEDLTTLEQLLAARAGEVPSLNEAPRSMLARARRRVARNAVMSVAAAGLLIVGASAGLAALRHPVPKFTSQGPGPVLSCTGADLRATASLTGAMGSVEGAIRLTNFSDRTCTLTGRPVVTLYRSATHQLTVHVLDVGPQWKADGASPPAGWPVVRLRTGAVASVRIRWSNMCPQLSHPALWKVAVGAGASVDVYGADGTPPPPCNGPGQPYTLEVGPFEPSPVP